MPEPITSSNREPLDKFGQFLVEHLRDQGIDFCEMLASRDWHSPGLQTLQKDFATLGDEQKSIVYRCVMTAMDSAIYDFLSCLHERAKTQNDIQIVVDGQNIETLSNQLGAALHYQLFGEDGWQARFSKYGEAPDVA